MKKLVIHIYHTNENAAVTGARLAERIRQAAPEQGVALEVFIFGAAIGALADPAQAEYRDGLIALAKNGITVNVCRQAAETMGQAEAVKAMGLSLEYARDAFIRFALEGATVISL